jgi:hypothetical protein
VEEKAMKRMNKPNLEFSCLWALLLVVALTDSSAGLAQTTAFTYQGKLTEAGNPVARSCSPLRQSRSRPAIKV